MTDRPIIFSGPMVRALLDGRKTQTRRVLKPQPYGTVGGWQKVFATPPYFEALDHAGKPLPCAVPNGKDVCSPYPNIRYAIGDRLWVREAWRVGAWHYHNAEVAVDYCDGPRKEWLGVDDGDLLHRLIDQSRTDASRARVPLRDSYYEYTWSPGNSPCRSRPSIHMPRWASRLTLIVTDVRVQRLQDISGEDCIAEGVECETCAASWSVGLSACNQRGCFEVRQNFRTLWNSLHGPDAWDQNPWVCAISFDVRRGNIDDREAG